MMVHFAASKPRRANAPNVTPGFSVSVSTVRSSPNLDSRLLPAAAPFTLSFDLDRQVEITPPLPMPMDGTNTLGDEELAANSAQRPPVRLDRMVALLDSASRLRLATV